MAELLRAFLELVSKFFGLIFVKSPVTPTPEPVPPPPQPEPTPIPIPPPPPPPAPPPFIPPRTMYDSTNPFDIPVEAQMVAGYVDGAFAWSQAGWDRFPNAVKVRIACFATSDQAHVLDVEAGCATVTEAVQWTQRHRNVGHDPTLYFSASLYPQVAAAFHAIGALVPYVWIAQWDGIAEPWAGAVAKQYANPSLTHFHYDLSYVPGRWPFVDQ